MKEVKKKSMLIAAVVLLLTAALFVGAAGADHPAGGHSDWKAVSSENDLPTEEAGNYYLTDEITLTKLWTVPNGETNLCLNGHVIEETGGSYIYVPSGATLNLYDCNSTSPTPTRNFTVDLDGPWTKTDTQATKPLADIIANPSLLVDNLVVSIPGGCIIGNSDGTGRYIPSVYVFEGSFTMNGGNIVGNNSSSTAGGVSVTNGGSFTMNGGNIVGNKGLASGGVSVDTPKPSQGQSPLTKASTFTMNGGNIVGNSGDNVGGVSINTDNDTYSTMATFNGGNIVGNRGNNGGGVALNRSGGGQPTYTVTGTIRICGNTATGTIGYGGGVYLQGTDFTLSGTASITGNTAANGGGGVWISGVGPETGETFYKMYVSGAPVITNNMVGSSTDNVSFEKDQTYQDQGKKIILNGAFTGEICVNRDNTDAYPFGVTTGNTGAEHFVSDGDDGNGVHYFGTEDNGDLKWASPAAAYPITIASSIENGTVTTSPSYAASNATVTLTVTPETGYQLKANSLTYKPAGGSETPITGNSFTMPTPAAAVTVSAEFEPTGPTPVLYKVTFASATGGTAEVDPAAASTTGVAKGTTINITATPTEGYKFVKWTCDKSTPWSESQDNPARFTMPESDLVFTPVFAAIPTITVSFDAKDGEGSMENQVFRSNEAQNLRQNQFTRTGYTFAGWAEAESATEATYTDGQSVTFTSEADTTKTLYAVWTPNTYKVTFDDNNGTSTKTDIQQTYDQKYQLPTDPTWGGHIFDGWFTAKEGGTQVTADMTVKITADTTLYAHWSEVTQYTVTLTKPDAGIVKFQYKINGAADYTDYITSFNVNSGSSLELNAVLTEGYTFTKWAEGKTNNPLTIASVTEDISYTPTVQPTSAEVTAVTVSSASAYVGDKVTVTVTGSKAGAATVTYPASLGGATEVAITLTGATPTWTSGDITVAKATAEAGETVSAKGTTQASAAVSAPFKAYAKTITLTAPSSQTAGTAAEWTVSIPLAAALTVVLAEDEGSSAGTITGLGDVTFVAAGETSQKVNITASAAGTLKLKATAEGWTTGTATVPVSAAPANVSLTPSASYANSKVTVQVALAEGSDQATVDQSVTLKVDGADVTDTITVKAGEAGPWTVDLTTTPAAGDHTIAVACTAAGTDVVTFTTPSVNVTVPATTYTVTYAAGEGVTGNVPVDSTAYSAGAQVTVLGNVGTPAPLAKEGYTFNGWKDQDNTARAAGSTFNISKDMTLTSQWTAVTPTYTVTFNGNKPAGASGEVSGVPQDITDVTSGSKITKPSSDPTLTGYTFGGWFKEAACTNEWIFATEPVTANTTLYAKWTANTYTVKFNANGGSGTMADQSFTYDVAKNLTTSAFTYTGKTFAGWNTDSAATTALYTDGASVKNLTSEAGGVVTLYAVWSNKEAKSITKGTLTNGDVTISSDEAGQTVISQAVEGTTVYLKPVGNTGYTYTANSLAAKYNDGSEKTLTPTETSSGSGVYKFTMPDFPVTVTAGFTANEYTVKFNANGGSGTMDDQSFTYDVAKNLTTNAFTKTGYTFTGWDTDSAGATVVYADQASVKNLTTTAGATVTLYAVWTPKEYTITYKDQGGAAFSGTHETGYPTTHTYGTATTLKGATKTGYTFDGWFMESDCSGSAVTTIAATAENPVLYAKWTANTYTITYKDQGDQTYSGDNESALVKTHTYGTATTLVDGTKADEGTTKFAFEGWFDNSACTGDKVTTLGATAYTADITLYAKWKQTITPTEDHKATIPDDEQTIVPEKEESPEVKMIEVDGVTQSVTFSKNSAVPSPTTSSQGYTGMKVFAKFEIATTITPGADTRFVIDIENPQGIYSSKNIFLRHHSAGGWDDKHIQGTQITGDDVPAGFLRLSFPVDACSPFAIVYETPAARPSKSSSSQGSSTWLTEPAAQPTAEPTPTPTPGAVETPGVKPVTPTETPAKTPAPFVGILAGLGCAAALFGLRRK